MIEPSGTARPTRILEIDALRGIAALAVLLLHFLDYYDATYGHSQEMFLRAPWGGIFGVKLFFCISGFVILGTLRRTKVYTEFLITRFLRLYPAFWASFIPTLVAPWLLMPQRSSGAMDVVCNTTMMAGLLGCKRLAGPYWTLEVELCFYAIMLSLYMSGLLSRQRLPQVLGAWLFVSIVAGLVVDRQQPPLFVDLTILPSIAMFAAGMVIYEIAGGAPARAHLLVLALAGVSQIVWGNLRFGNAAYLVLTAATLAATVAFRPAFLRLRPLRFLGEISYGTYLIHMNVGLALIFFGYQLGASPWLSVPAAIAASILLAVPLRHFVELPAIRLAQRWRARAIARALRPSALGVDASIPTTQGESATSQEPAVPHKPGAAGS